MPDAITSLAKGTLPGVLLGAVVSAVIFAAAAYPSDRLYWIVIREALSSKLRHQ